MHDGYNFDKNFDSVHKYIQYIFNYHTAPTNNIAPKLMGDKFGWKIILGRENSLISIMCQVVGYPVPIFK